MPTFSSLMAPVVIQKDIGDTNGDKVGIMIIIDLKSLNYILYGTQRSKVSFWYYSSHFRVIPRPSLYVFIFTLPHPDTSP